ncbi:MAG: bifunctional phosphopantothenoylcysteine decarboxylase/phosphopantothenate--cysteine ligase CoaBC [Rhodospirillales bacterium]|nr:bifunctional phosphopantothenoylcysteine decarboxylase/phosphopantothenate--cysteine ligase CoaBC [Rhodospirillales bacterium]
MDNKQRVLLIISGGIAAYKSLDLIRELNRIGIGVRCILTENASKFVTPLSLTALSKDTVYQDLFSISDENTMGHIQLSRNTDLVLVAPATANIIAKMSCGIADDLATTTLLATDKPVIIAPSMNVRMWSHASTQNNISVLLKRGIKIIGPENGEMACGEFGLGRMSNIEKIGATLNNFFKTKTTKATGKLKGRKVVVTSGPTHEAIDPIRYITNQSSGKQGFAIARALQEQGASTTLITGPTQIPDPPGIYVKHITTAEEMLQSCLDCLPADIVVCAAAVADWRMKNKYSEKIKKEGEIFSLELVENPDILATVAGMKKNRPNLVIGFAAETQNLLKNASIKLDKKGCDWILANNVSKESEVFGGDNNQIKFISKNKIEEWPVLSKEAIGEKLATRIIAFLKDNKNGKD